MSNAFSIRSSQNAKCQSNALSSFSGQEKYMIGRYVREVAKVEKIIRKKIVWRGLVNSTAQSIPFFGYAGALCYGGFLVADGEIHFKNIIKYVNWNFQSMTTALQC